MRDPAPNHYKVLDVEFIAGGKPLKRSFAEHGFASLAVPVESKPEPEKVLADLSSDWTITSFAGANAPSAPLVVKKLMSWSESSDPRLRYFSGRAVYEKSIVPSSLVPPRSSLILDLGDVHDIANVYINGKFIVCLWEPPYRLTLDLSDSRLLNLRIELVNTWPNRMIGDAIARKAGAAEPKRNGYPEWVLDDRPDSGTGIFTWSNFDYGWKATDKPLPAGLVGPVRILER